MDVAITTLVITSIAGLAKLFWSDWQAGRREERSQQAALERAILERQWAMEDRRATAEVLAIKVETTAATLAKTAAHANSEVRKALDANTVLTQEVGKKADAAYQEANTVNNKIESLGMQLTGGQPLHPPGGD